MLQSSYSGCSDLATEASALTSETSTVKLGEMWILKDPGDSTARISN